MAAKSLNRAQLIGNLGADPEPRYLPSGMTVCNLSIATWSKATKCSSRAG